MGKPERFHVLLQYLECLQNFGLPMIAYTSSVCGASHTRNVLTRGGVPPDLENHLYMYMYVTNASVTTN